MVCSQFTNRLSKGVREMELDLSPLHLLVNAASLVSKGKLSLDSSIFDLDDEKKATGVTATFGPFDLSKASTSTQTRSRHGLRDTNAPMEAECSPVREQRDAGELLGVDGVLGESGNRSTAVVMACSQFTDRLSKGEREMELDLSSLHLLANAASLVSEGKFSLDSSIFDLDDEKKAAGGTTTFEPFVVEWIVTKKRSPRARGLAIHAQRLSSGPVNVVGQKNKQETWRGAAENRKKWTRPFNPTETPETGRVSKKAKKTGLAALVGPSELPIQYMDKIREMRGRDVMLVMEKTLTATDMSRSQSRLSIPKSQIRETFLSEEEILILDGKEGIKVSLIEPCLEVSHGLQLKKWTYTSNNFSYVFTERWNGVAHPYQRNELEEHVFIQLWSFRVHGNLRFCLTRVEEAPVGDN